MSIFVLSSDADPAPNFDAGLTATFNLPVQNFTDIDKVIKAVKEDKSKEISFLLLCGNVKYCLEMFEKLKVVENQIAVISAVKAAKPKDVIELHEFGEHALTHLHHNEEIMLAWLKITVENALELFDYRQSNLQMKETINDQEEENKNLKLQCSLDGLTGVANRRCFDEQLDTEWRRGLRNKFPVSLIMVDIDFFKGYNDHYGHQMGDECIQAVAKALRATQHRPGDMVARYGGEEFSMILPDTPPQGALTVGENLRQNVEQLNISHAKSDASFVVTVSVGVSSMMPSKDATFIELLQQADKALYVAKRGGRNRVELFN